MCWFRSITIVQCGFVWWIAVKWTNSQKRSGGHFGVWFIFFFVETANKQRTVFLPIKISNSSIPTGSLLLKKVINSLKIFDQNWILYLVWKSFWSQFFQLNLFHMEFFFFILTQMKYRIRWKNFKFNKNFKCTRHFQQENNFQYKFPWKCCSIRFNSNYRKEHFSHSHIAQRCVVPFSPSISTFLLINIQMANIHHRSIHIYRQSFKWR